MADKRIKQFIKNPRRGLFVLAIPLFISMFMQAMYNLVDTAFVGRLGAESIAALTFAFPVYFVYIVINAGLGAGVSSRIARFMGEQNKKQAENTAMHGIILAVIVSIIVSIVGFIFVRPLFILLGAEGTVLELAISYMQIIFIGGTFLVIVSLLNYIFAAQGDPKTAMKIMVYPLILNIILDPIFIYTFGYGVKGAAIATTIAFIFGLVLSLFYIKTKSHLDLRLRSFKFSKNISKQIINVGLPSTLMMMTTAVTFMFVFRFVAHFGVNHVAAVGLSFRLEHIAVTPILAIALSMIPLIGMLYGAKEYAKLKSVTFYGLKMVLLFSIIVGAVLFLFPRLFLRIFTSDPTLLSLGSAYLRVVVFSYPLMGIGYLVGRVLQGVGAGLPALVINLVRGILIPVPLFYLFIFVLGFGYLSVAVAMITGAVVSSLIGVIWLGSRFKKIGVKVK